MAQSRRQFVTGGDMRTPVIFYTAHTTDDFMPGETTVEYYRCFADVYPPSMKDLERDNEASITMVTWHPQNDKPITTEMYSKLHYHNMKVSNTTSSMWKMIPIITTILKLLGSVNHERED